MKGLAGRFGRPLRARAVVVPLAAMLLAGCTGNKTELPTDWLSIIEAEPARAPEPPAECNTAGDPKWKLPPEGDEHAADVARRERENKNAFAELKHRRRVCAAGQVQTASKGENNDVAK